eukprot:1000431_1
MAFNVSSYTKIEEICTHPTVENDIYLKMMDHVDNLLKINYASDSNHLVIADIGAADGAFTTQFIDKIIRKAPKQFITKYLLDPFSNHKDIIRLSGEQFAGSWPTKHCDIIVAKAVAHLFADFDKWLSGCYRILKPNGAMFIWNISKDATFPWDNIAQQSFVQSLSERHEKWREMNPPPNVMHYNFMHEWNISTKAWRKFVAGRCW